MSGLLERVESIIAKNPDLDPALLKLTERLILDRKIIECVREMFSQDNAAIYIMSGTNDNKCRMYFAAAELARSMPDVPVFIDDLPIMGDWYDGYEAERKELAGMFPNPISSIQLPLGQYNTYTEAIAIIREAVIAEKRSNLVVVAPPMHQIRALTTVVSVLQNIHPALEPVTNIFNLPCEDYSDNEWEMVVRHSQGVGGKTRMQWLETELSKVAGKDKYANTNAPSRILEYMDVRNSRIGAV